MTAKPIIYSNGIKREVTVSDTFDLNNIPTIPASKTSGIVDGNGQLLSTAIPTSLLNGMTFRGTYDASSSSDGLPSGLAVPPLSPQTGDLWISTSAYAAANINSGDLAIYNGSLSSYQAISNNNNVSTVAGRKGAVTLSQADINGLTAGSTPTFYQITLTDSMTVGGDLYTNHNIVLTTGKTVDGRDLSVDGTFLDSLATATKVGLYGSTSGSGSNSFISATSVPSMLGVTTFPAMLCATQIGALTPVVVSDGQSVRYNSATNSFVPFSALTGITNGSVGTAQLADSSVTSLKLVDGSVTNSKIGTGAVTNTCLGTNAVSYDKMVTMAANGLLGTNAGSGQINALTPTQVAAMLSHDNLTGINSFTGSTTTNNSLHLTSAMVNALVAAGGNKFAPLDANNAVPMANIPAGLLSGMTFKGTWDATTTFPSATPSTGWLYVVSKAGTYNTTSVYIGDWIIYNGVVWQIVPSTGNVISVAGKTGTVTLSQADVSGLTVTDIPAFTGIKLSGQNSAISIYANNSVGGNVTAVSLTTDGDMLYRNSGTIQRLPAGTAGQVLGNVAGIPTWTSAPSSLTSAQLNTLTTTTSAGLLGATTSGPISMLSSAQVNAMIGVTTAPAMLASVSSNAITSVSVATGQSIYYNGSSFATFTPFVNPMTSNGDIIYSSGGTPSRLAMGAGNALYFLQANSGGTAPTWTSLAASSLTSAQINTLTTASSTGLLGSTTGTGAIGVVTPANITNMLVTGYTAPTIVVASGAGTKLDTTVTVAALQSVRRNSAGTAFEAFTPSTFASPLATTGDIIYSADVTGTPAKLGIGSSGKVLGVSSGIPAWITIPASSFSSNCFFA